MPLDWSPFWLSLRYAALATLLAALVALPLAWLLVHRPFPGRALIDAAATLPLILPPAVLVYYFVSALGRWKLRFSWDAAVAVSAVYTMPVLLLAIRGGLDGVERDFLNTARGLGAGEWRTFWRVTLPLALPALLPAVLAAFARAFADFMATAVVARNVGAWWMLPAAVLALAAVFFANRANRLRRTAAPA